MALVFDEKDINIDLVSSGFEENYDKFQTKTIVYPVLKYKIYAPVIETVNLNLFQKNVLSLLNKGKFDIKNISEWLQLDIQLVQVIVAELGGKGLLNGNAITEEGRALAEGTFSWFENAENIRKDIYYIYQDVYTHKIYPLLMKFDLDIDDYVFENNKIFIESKGKKSPTYASLIEPRGVNFNTIIKPEVEDIFYAISIHSKINAPKAVDLKKSPNLIQYFDEEPTLGYLGITIYSHINNKTLEDVKVIDPFGIYETPFWLKDNLLKAMNENTYLKSLFHSLVENAIEKARKQKESLFKDLHKEVETYMNDTFDFELKEFDELNKSLSEFYFDLKQYEMYAFGKPLKDAFRQSQIVLETLLDTFYKKYKAGYIKVLEIDPKLNALYTEEVSVKVHSINKKAHIPKWKFPKFFPNTIRPALKAPSKASLRAMYVGAVLAAWHDELNPMNNLIQKKDDLLIFLEKVADGRNAVGHKYKDIKENEINQYFNEVEEIRIGIEEIINIFLGEK